MAIVDRLPRIFPRGQIRVEDEEHTFRVFETNSGPEAVKEYTLDKAPFINVESVIAIVDGTETELTEGLDYTTGPNNEMVRFDTSLGKLPDAGTTFRVTYLANSVISRYSGAFDDEIDRTLSDLQYIRDGKGPDGATGRQLDELGKLYGPLGNRRNREDPEYRAFIKSIVQSFAGRGTVSGIKFAVSAATGIDTDDIIVQEDFQSNSYNIVILPREPLDSSVITRVADIADPSAVDLDLIKFKPEQDVMKLSDRVSVSSVKIISDETGANDFVFISSPEFVEDKMDSSDSVVDIRTRQINKARWEPQTSTHEVRWSFFEWADNSAFYDLNASFSTVDASDTANDSEFVVAFETVNTQ